MDLLPLLLQVCLILSLTEAKTLAANDRTRGEKHSADYCAMYDLCGKRSDGKVLNCPYGSPAVKPDDLLSSKIQSLCPTITGNVCCTEAQFDTLKVQVQQAIPLLVGCPACLRNFLNLFCELTCSPNQSLFINVTTVDKVGGNLTVGGINYFVSDAFGEGLYNSCKDVKFGTANSLAMQFIGAGAQNVKEWFAFIGKKAAPDDIGSPYAIMFPPNATKSSGMEPMNVSAYSCGDTSLGCSCGDCPSSSVCSSSSSTTTKKRDSCSLKVGSLTVKCVDLTLTVLYIVLLFVFLGWGLYYRTRERKPAYRTKSVSNVNSGGQLHSRNQEKDENLPMHQIIEDVSQNKNEVRLSAVQGYMSNFYRKYGLYVARNPIMVLASSLAIVILLCIGLIRFKVETRPEKLWVGPGSRAAEEKQFFDSHLAPFYRIEQLILGTVPDHVNGTSPRIVSEDNIKFLFEVQKKVDAIRANYSGLMVSLQDICMKPLDKECATQSILQYFKMDPSNFDNYGGVEHLPYCFEVANVNFTSCSSGCSSFCCCFACSPEKNY